MSFALQNSANSTVKLYRLTKDYCQAIMLASTFSNKRNQVIRLPEINCHYSMQIVLVGFLCCSMVVNICLHVLQFYLVTFRKIFYGCLNNTNGTLIKVQGEILLYSINVILAWNFMPAWTMLTLGSFHLTIFHALRIGMKLPVTYIYPLRNLVVSSFHKSYLKTHRF